eukprot:TRINITY_DN941_c1_g1_i2.p1 TRINITY_DN941_c1_g1~~TRINITY_DN941_c1_g1_i2.p1  ORF type:complete len:518 (-),score=91.80 TRINITY_DN941_c1_g1_i2:161-1639(-)
MSFLVYVLFGVLAFLLIKKLSPVKKDPNKYPRSIAVVIGSSFSGIATARVLSDYYEKVIIFERDALDAKSVIPRRGVPQGGHIHVLLIKGLSILKEWFPNLSSELLSHGAKPVDFFGDQVLYFEDQYLGRWHMNGKFMSYACRRPLLEAIGRNELLKTRKNVELKSQCTVCSLVEKDGKITGVEYYSGLDNESVLSQSADLVIDCSGAKSQTPKFLEKLGYQPPRTEQVSSYLQYVTCFFKNLDTKLPNGNSFKIHTVAAKAPSATRSCWVFPTETGDYQVMLGSMNKDYIQPDITSFMGFVKSLPTPLLRNALENATPITEPYEYRYKGSIRQMYMECKLPSRFIVVGDAFSSFTPIWGQGITLAVLEAKEIENLLKLNCSPDLMSQQFYKNVTTLAQGAWDLATQGDLKWPKTEGKKSAIGTLLNNYFTITFKLGANDPFLFEVAASVMHMMKSPLELFRPYVLFSVISYALGFKKMTSPQSPPFASKDI